MMTTDSDDARDGAESQPVWARFIETIKDWLHSLDLNAQVFVEIMNDEELQLTIRGLAAAVLVYLAASTDLIRDRLGPLGLIDDVLVMIAGLGLIVPLMPGPRLQYYRRKYEAVAKLSEYEQTMKAALGGLWDLLVRFVDGLRTRKYRGTSPEEVVQTPDLREALLDETMALVADLEFDAARMGSRLPPPDQVFKLLASSLEDATDQEDESDLGDRPQRLLGRLHPGGTGSSHT